MDDIAALLKGRNKELVEMAENVLRKLKEEVFEIVDHGERNGRNEQGDCFMWKFGS